LSGSNGVPVGVGISGMRERVRELGGQIRIRAAQPGTMVEVLLPTKKAQPVGAELPQQKPVARAQA
ncbi:MAG TPA: hypothetical protein VH744_00210, partial [Terriglobales bacterium]